MLKHPLKQVYQLMMCLGTLSGVDMLVQGEVTVCTVLRYMDQVGIYVPFSAVGRGFCRCSGAMMDVVGNFTSTSLLYNIKDDNSREDREE